MNFFVSTLARFRRSRSIDEPSDPIAIVRLDRDIPEVVSARDVAGQDLVVTKHPQRTIVALGPSAVCDVSKTHDLGPQLIQLLDADRPQVLWVDLGQIEQVSSECLNQLISVNCHARSKGIQLVLANLCQPLREVFRITRLDRLFELGDES